MYPDFQYLFEGIFHTDVPSFWSAFKTFGFFVALAFLSGFWIVKAELQRKQANGLMHPEMLPYAKAKKYLSRKERRLVSKGSVPIYPHQRMGDIVLLALVGGIVGAKLFHALESWQEFVQDPLGTLFSGSGLTFYGGLILAAGLIYIYLRRHNVSVVHFCDAIAPALMLAYAVGRLGCHFSGDGDWGIFNSAYLSLPDASLKPVPEGAFLKTLSDAPSYLAAHFASPADVPHAYFPAPEGWPVWPFAMNFPHNVNNEGVAISGCIGDYCRMLPAAVFPTSFYEAVIGILLFGVLWALRRKLKYAGHLFGLYLVLNGGERFLIEKIKVNYRYDWGFLHPAQSEIIAVVLMVAGLSLLVFYRKKKFVYF